VLIITLRLLRKFWFLRLCMSRLGILLRVDSRNIRTVSTKLGFYLKKASVRRGLICIYILLRTFAALCFDPNFPLLFGLTFFLFLAQAGSSVLLLPLSGSTFLSSLFFISNKNKDIRKKTKKERDGINYVCMYVMRRDRGMSVSDLSLSLSLNV